MGHSVNIGLHGFYEGGGFRKAGTKGKADKRPLDPATLHATHSQFLAAQKGEKRPMGMDFEWEQQLSFTKMTKQWSARWHIQWILGEERLFGSMQRRHVRVTRLFRAENEY